MTRSAYAKLSGCSKQYVGRLVAAGMPLDSKEAADRWRGLRAGSRTKRPTPTKRPGAQAEAPPVIVPPVALDADTPQGAFQRQLQVERQLHQELQAAIRERSRDLRSLLVAHTSAVAGLASARKAVLDLAERERELVSGSWVRAVMTEHDGAVVALVKAMPRQLAGRIAPHDPEHAAVELERWVQETFFATLHATTPWK